MSGTKLYDTTMDGIEEEKATGVNEICPSGDVVFLVGTEEKRFRVSSAVLRNASPYFRALLGPRFSEGQGLSEDSPKEIALPEDDAKSLEIIFNVLHLRNDAVPRSPDPALIFKIAVTADKFDCIVALQHASTVWLNPTTFMDGKDLGRLMAAACIFDDAHAFKNITYWVLMYYKGSYVTLLDGKTDDRIPCKSLGKCLLILDRMD